jgi:endoglucanase
MKSSIIISILFLFVFQSFAQLDEWPRKKETKLVEIRTVSDKVLVAFFLSPKIDNISTEISEWKLNGKPSLKIDKWVTPNWSGTEFGFEHHIYLDLEEKLVQGKEYTLDTPYGNTTFKFDSREIFCESIKTNQSAYSALSTKRFANFSIWTGTGGGKKIEGDLPDYEVFEMESGRQITSGTMTALGENENSGDFVYRLDLSKVPEGGPYQIEVKGYGRSHPFGVGGAFSQKLAYVSFRGLLHQRCGMEQMTPYFDHDIRGICHHTVFVTDSPNKEAKVVIPENAPIITTVGGYHDAGDADRQDHHMIAPIVLLTYFDMFPGYFTDLQFNIPDKFDPDFKPIGQGNGIPDIIDEAEWGTLIWEILQEKNGGVRSGTERNGYPTDGPGLDMDTVPYATFAVSKNSTNLAAGLFAHLSRALKPYNPKRSAELQQKAELAWAFAGEEALPAHKLYYFTQYYLLTGDENIHKKLIELAPVVSVYEKNHQDNPRRVHNTDVMLGAHFISYLVQDDRPKDPGVVKLMEEVVRKVADDRIRQLEENPWPNGTAKPNRWWGSQTAQGQYADPMIIQWRLTKEQKYIDAASQLMDYNQGINPIGKSFLTGVGFDRTHDPLSHDSYPMKDKGWGPAPGLQIFGPGNLQQLNRGFPPMIPDIQTLPAQRQWADNRKNVSGSEFTVPESITYPSVIYTILAGGEKWDRKTEPFEELK